MAQLPPLGYATFFLEPQSGAAARAGSSSDDGSSREQKQEAGQSATQAADAREAAAEAAEVAAEEEEVQQGWLENEEKNEHTAVLDSGLVRLEFDTRTGQGAGARHLACRCCPAALCLRPAARHARRGSVCQPARLFTSPLLPACPAACRPAAQRARRGRLRPPGPHFCLVQLERRAGQRRKPRAGQRRIRVQAGQAAVDPSLQARGPGVAAASRRRIARGCCPAPSAHPIGPPRIPPRPCRRPNGRYDLSATHETSAAPGWRSLWERLWGGGGGGGGRVPAGAGPVARLEIVEGVNVWEARQTFADWATLVTRLVLLFEGWSARSRQSASDTPRLCPRARLIPEKCLNACQAFSERMSG